MNIGRILKFLISGIVIGAVLFFAGFGVINLLDKPPEVPVVEETRAPVEVDPVTPPTIEISSNQNSSASAPQQGTGNSPIKIKPLSSDNTDVSVENNEQLIQKMEFGTLILSTVNSVNGEATNSDFLIENSQNVAIALVKDTATSTLSLPVGDYKITVSNAGQKVIRFLGVKADTNGAEVFEMNVPVLTGEVPNTDSTVSTSPTVEDSAIPTEESNAETTAEVNAPETNEASEAPDVVIASEGNPAPAVVAASTDNTSQASNALGGLRLSALTKSGKRPTFVSFIIQRLSGELIDTIQNVKTQQLSLPAGKYKITAQTANSSTVKEIEVLSTKGIHEIFLIPADSSLTQQSSPQAAPVTSPQASVALPPTTTSVATPSSEAATPSTNNTAPQVNDSNKSGKLELFAQNGSNNSPVRSNFYVQMPNGTMVASKVYVDSIGYRLPEGPYKVIVRATGFKDKSVSLNVRSGQTRRETFKLESVNAPPPVPNNSSQQNATPNYGGLTVNIVSAVDRSALPANIVITQRDGTPLKQAIGVASASFDLPAREFVIRVTHDGFTTNHQVNIVKGKLAIKTISIDTTRLSRQERRRLRRERQDRSQ